MAEQSLQEIAKREEAIERLLTGRKLNQEVDIAVGTGLVPQHGAEESEASYTEAKNLNLDFSEALSHLLAGECVGGHTSNLSREMRHHHTVAPEAVANAVADALRPWLAPSVSIGSALTAPRGGMP